MRNALVGLLAIPLILAIVVNCQCAQACVGGDPGKTYLEQNMTVPAGQYISKEFKVDKIGDWVYVDHVQGVRMYIIADAEMSNFTAGKDFTAAYNSSKDGSNYGGHANLTSGKYWMVLDNRASTAQATTDVHLYHPADKCGGGAISPAPGFDAGLLVVAVLAVVALGLKKGLGAR